MDSYIVYIHTSPSGKRYIGITKRVPNKRWQNGRGYLGNEKFSRAIRKYGWNNFQHEIVAEGLSEIEALKLEMKLIEEYDSFNNGYNQSPGGEMSLCCPTAQAKMKDKLAKPVSQYTKNGIWINDYSSLSDASRSVGVKYTGISGCLCGRYKTAGGFRWSYKNEQIPVYIDKQRKNQYQVAQLSIDDAHIIRTFDNVQQASRGTQIPAGSILEACGDNVRTAYGFFWAKVNLLEQKLPVIRQKIASNRKMRKVICETTGKRFDSIRQAADFYGVSYDGVGLCCRGKIKRCGIHPETKIPLVWKYEEEKRHEDL